MSTTSIPFKPNGPTHSALCFASMQRKKPFITAEQLMSCFPTRFSKPSRAIRSMEILEKNGLVDKVGGGWRINLTGYDYLRSIAKVSGFVKDTDGHY